MVLVSGSGDFLRLQVRGQSISNPGSGIIFRVRVSIPGSELRVRLLRGCARATDSLNQCGPGLCLLLSWCLSVKSPAEEEGGLRTFPCLPSPPPKSTLLTLQTSLPFLNTSVWFIPSPGDDDPWRPMTFIGRSSSLSPPPFHAIEGTVMGVL